MGYTHYWNHKDIQPGAWAELCSDARRIIKAAGVPLAGWNGSGKPEINGEEIRFNGKGDDACETFVLTPDATDFSFCKTGNAPYDVVVAAIILRARLTVPTFRINSDGTWEEWRNIRDLYEKVFGEPTPDEEPFV